MAANAHVQLPVQWDGHPVAWGPWEPPPFVCDVYGYLDGSDPEAESTSRTPSRCTRCARVGVQWIATGTISRHGPATFLHTPHPLYAHRCPWCGHDTVYDGENAWDLDDNDYGPAGSWPEKEARRGQT
jgi:hypothetical protein